MADIRSSTHPDRSDEDTTPPTPTPPQGATGHYGPGYADPTRHLGDTLPGQPAVDGDGRPAEQPPLPSATPVTDAGSDSESRPDLSSDEVGFRPPDRLPSEGAPESENAALIFERS